MIFGFLIRTHALDFSTPPFIALLYQTLLEHLCVFPLGCLLHQCYQEGQNETFWRILLKKITTGVHIRWLQLKHLYLLFVPLNRGFTINPNSLVKLDERRDFIIQILYQSKQCRFVLTEHFHFISIIYVITAVISKSRSC